MTLHIHQPTTPLAIDKPVALTIGTFDGVHAGHCSLLSHLSKEAKRRKTTTAVVTYYNHPSELLNPAGRSLLLCSLDHKLKLIEEAISPHYLVLFHFDRDFAAQTPEAFLTRLMAILPFSYLNMGYDGRLGRNREGDRTMLTTLGATLGFDVEYMPPYRKNGNEVSSTKLRHLITEGMLAEASLLLGRPYSIVSKVVKGAGRGALLGFPTANFPVEGLVVPPYGVYIVEARGLDGESLYGVANLGHAPTLNDGRPLFLEVHLLDCHHDLYGKTLEIVFLEFLRPEQRFPSVEALQHQLECDVKIARHSKHV